jgi:hypothetical protein
MTIKAFLRRLAAAERRARERIAQAIVLEQSRLIDAGEAPQGGRQKANAKGYADRKAGRPPLVRDGILRDPTKWQIKIGRKSIEIRPPAERREAAYVLHNLGFRTLLSGLTERIRARAQAIVNEEVSR